MNAELRATIIVLFLTLGVVIGLLLDVRERLL